MVWSLVIILIILNWVVSLRLFAIAQQESYNVILNSKSIKKYWIKLAILSIPCFVGIFLNKYFIANVIISCLYVILCVIWLGKYLNYRTKLKFTQRASLSYSITNLIPSIIGLTLLFFVPNLLVIFIYYCALIALLPLYLFLILKLLNCLFGIKNKRFINKSIEKLDNLKIIKIAITGSFGKTSCKNILKKLLEQKYKVYATPSNYNTPMGIALSIEEMPEDTQVFIMEMGARKVGDIDELCYLYKPDFGIITGVSDQHLLTFKTIENIYDEKFKLAKHINQDGVCVFNGNNRFTLKMYKQCTCPKLLTRLNKFADFYASDIALNKNGSEFNIHIKDDVLSCQTILLGKHNIQNIVMCVAMAKQLGLDNKSIVEGIKNLDYIPHRLQLIRSNKINIIDDSYNSNMLGIKYAIECLSKFETRKVVLSQGIVETGARQKSDNIAIGKMLGRVADVILLVGVNTNYILEGIKSINPNKIIYTYSSFENAKKDFPLILKEEDTFLIQNDLPDTYC